MLAVAGERYPMSGAVAMGALGAAGMLTVGQIGGATIGAQQGYHTSQHLAETAPETFERYAGGDKKHFAYEYRELAGDRFAAASATEVVDGKVKDTGSFVNSELLEPEVGATLAANAATDVPAVKESYLFGSRRALQLTAYVPGAMAVGYLILLIYYKLIGGYKVLNADGTVAESH